MNTAKITDILKQTTSVLSSEGSINWHMLTLDEIKSLYDFAVENEKQTKDHRVIFLVQENSVASIVKVANADKFFDHSKTTDHTVSEWPDCAEDITDYGAW
jgi:hypothetical protein